MFVTKVNVMYVLSSFNLNDLKQVFLCSREIMNRPNTQQHFNTNTPFNYNNVYSSPTHNRFESPVRDNQKMFAKQDGQYKDHYGVSDFKFSDIATTRPHTNHANFCELTFDGTMSSKHHHRKKNIIKRVTSTTTVNCTAKKGASGIEPAEGQEQQLQGKKIVEESIKDTTFHNLAEQFKNKLKFIEMPVLLNKHVLCTSKEKSSRFEVILSPKSPTSYSSVETMSNLLKASEHQHKKIILTSNSFQPSKRPGMRDREIQTTIIGVRNYQTTDDYYNMRLASVNDIFYNMDFMSSNEDDLFHIKSKKTQKLNLTVTHLPCLEIKCSTIFFEMPANSVRTPMPRRTLSASNTIIDDYHETCATIEEKLSEPTLTVTSSDASHPLKDKILNLLNSTEVAKNVDYNKKVNELCDLIGSLLTESLNKSNKKQKRSVRNSADMRVNLKKRKADDTSTKPRVTIAAPPYQMCPSSPSNNSFISILNAQIRSRNFTPASTPSCQISKVPTGESYNQIRGSSSRNKDTFYSNTDPNLSIGLANQNLNSIPTISSISNGSRHIEMVLKASGDNIAEGIPKKCTPVPEDVFIVPPKVTKLLKNYEISSNAEREYPAKTINKAIAKPPDSKISNMLKKSQTKYDVVNHFQCTTNMKHKKGEYDCIGPSVTFSSMVDVFGDDKSDMSFEEPTCSTVKQLTGLVMPKSSPIQIEDTVINNDESFPQNNCNPLELPVRQIDNKPKLNFSEKQGSFCNSSFFSSKKEVTTTAPSCLQKRKEYDSKLKRQMQIKQPSKIPLLKIVTGQPKETIKTATLKTGKSKLPLKLPESAENKEIFLKTQALETMKLLNANIKNTPFVHLKPEIATKKQDTSPLNTPKSAKNARMNIETSVNVTKDVTPNFQKRKSSF